MKLEPIENGFAIDAADLAGLLDREPAEVQQMMRESRITSGARMPTPDGFA